MNAAAAAQLICLSLRYDHVTALLYQLHWFKLHSGLTSKLALAHMDWHLHRLGSHLGLHSRLDLAPKRLESRLNHHLIMT